MLLSSNRHLQMTCRRQRQRFPHLLLASDLTALISVGFNLLTSFEVTCAWLVCTKIADRISPKQSVVAGMLDAAQ